MDRVGTDRACFAAMNLLLTVLSQLGGRPFYGYGYAAATVIATAAGFGLLYEKFRGLEYETFMLQGQ